jgi:hypothetical protein
VNFLIGIEAGVTENDAAVIEVECAPEWRGRTFGCEGNHLAFTNEDHGAKATEVKMSLARELNRHERAADALAAFSNRLKSPLVPLKKSVDLKFELKHDIFFPCQITVQSGLQRG